MEKAISLPGDRAEKSLLCPVCQVDLVMSERQNIEVDYCPKCRGVWLDRGELDKIIDKSVAPAAGVDRRDDRQDSRRDRHYDDDDDNYRRGGHRRRPWLSDIFD